MSKALDVSKFGHIAGRRNKIINGNFDVWQRGTSQTSSGYGSADRWSYIAVGSTHTTSRQAFDLGQTEVPGNPKFFSRTIVNSVVGAGNSVRSVHRIEDVTKFSGKYVTLSFYAKANTAANIAVNFYQTFGTGGTPSTVVDQIEVTTIPLTTSWNRHIISFIMPSISGKTLGDNGDDHTGIHFWLDAGSNLNSTTNSLGQQSGTFDIAQVQLEEGNVATEFEQRSIGEELIYRLRFH